jgi:hypothetical protein
MKPIIIILSILLTIIFTSCTSPDIQYGKDDAVRLNLDSIQYLSTEQQPEYGKINPEIEPNTGRRRNPSVLRGTVQTVYENNQKYIDSLGQEQLAITRYYVFLDSLAYGLDNPRLEYIPAGLVDNVGAKVGMPDSTFWVETYNNPLDPPKIRQLTVETKEADECACGDFAMNIPPCENCEVPDIVCPFPWEERLENRDWYFAEAKFAYAYYNNLREVENTSAVERYPTDAGQLDLAFGYRFGDPKEPHFGLGLMFSTGVPFYAPESGINESRPQLTLYGRYQFDELWCMFPFVYANFGITVDEASLYLGRISYSADIDGWLGVELCDCEDDENDIDGRLRLAQKAAAESPDVDLSIPLSWGVGAGFDIPVHKFFDLSFDIGYRYISYADEINLYGFSVPTKLGNGMFLIRGGFTF